ncbi:MAG: T9SS type A sorting domain-containing protein [Bacteroidetes bacterium]|nr:T9SS type A sorting domain-containing protein [Bacteroidota bacterium]
MTRAFLVAMLILAVCSTSSAQHRDDEGIAIPLPDAYTVLTAAKYQESMSLSKAHYAFRQFALDNSDWNFRYDALRGTPHRAWGRGIQIEGFPAINLLNAPQAGKQFIENNARVLNLDPRNLRLLSSEIVSGKVYQKYTQMYDGVEVLFSYVDLRISDRGRVFMFGSDYHNGINVDATPTVVLEAAREFAKAGLPYSPSNENVSGGKLYILPLRRTDHIEYRLVYNFQVRSSMEELWDTYVDAHSGSIVWRQNLITHLHGGKGPNAIANVVNGRVMITIFPKTYTDAAQVVPLKNAYVWVAGKMYTTGDDGRFTADLGTNTTGQLIAKLSGPYVIARRDDTTRVSGGTPANAVQSMTVAAGQDLEIMWDNSNSISSERNTFYHLNVVRDWARSLDGSPNLSNLDAQVPGLVEIDSECNAFFDGRGVNFFKSSLTCGNTGEIASVVQHEFGHGIHIWLTTKLTGRAPVDGALKEAIADITSNLLHDDPRIGLGFLKNGTDGIIRNSNNTLRYPENVVNEIHDDGMILTGAVWDVRKAIGIERTARLYMDAMYGAPDGSSLGEALADYFIEFLLADDDDGDLSNGTPNSDVIISSFNAHGIPGSAIVVLHQGMPDQNSVDQPYEITGVARIAGNIDTDLLRIAQIDVVYSVDNWQTSQRMSVEYREATKSFIGYFPPQKAGSIVRYYIEVMDNFGSSLREPAAAPNSSYLFLVGYERRYYHDAETTDDWRVYTDATTGEWERAAPVGTWNTSLGKEGEVPYVQPNEDHTPGTGKVRCWVTGNAARGAGLGDNDVDDGETTLRTPDIDLTGMTQPVLRYYRWYSNDAGATPGTDYWTVGISSDGGSNWEILERTRQSDASWKPKVYVLRDIIDLTPKMTVRFIAADDDPGSLVEAAVDDFEVLDINQALVGVEKEPVALSLELEQNYPNPFNPSTTIAFTVPSAGAVRLTVFNSYGQEVLTLVDAQMQEGRHAVSFDARDLPSGLYMYELRANNTRLSRKMMLLE